jgi:transposase
MFRSAPALTRRPTTGAHIDFLEESIERLSAEIAERMRPFGEAIERLETIPGVGRRTAEAILAEIGPEVSRFPTYRHLASSAGMCPGNDESGGKRRSGKTTKGNPWLRAALVEAAHATGRRRNTYLCPLGTAHSPPVGARRELLWPLAIPYCGDCLSSTTAALMWL